MSTHFGKILQYISFNEYLENNHKNKIVWNNLNTKQKYTAALKKNIIGINKLYNKVQEKYNNIKVEDLKEFVKRNYKISEFVVNKLIKKICAINYILTEYILNSENPWMLIGAPAFAEYAEKILKKININTELYFFQNLAFHFYSEKIGRMMLFDEFDKIPKICFTLRYDLQKRSFLRLFEKFAEEIYDNSSINIPFFLSFKNNQKYKKIVSILHRLNILESDPSTILDIFSSGSKFFSAKFINRCTNKHFPNIYKTCVLCEKYENFNRFLYCRYNFETPIKIY